MWGGMGRYGEIGGDMGECVQVAMEAEKRQIAIDVTVVDIRARADDQPPLPCGNGRLSATREIVKLHGRLSSYTGDCQITREIVKIHVRLSVTSVTRKTIRPPCLAREEVRERW